jgi:hypothetical protein
METPAFWRECADRFPALVDPANDLYATETGDARSVLADLTPSLVSALLQPAASGRRGQKTQPPRSKNRLLRQPATLDEIYGLARQAGRVGGWILDESYIKWQIGGGPTDPTANRVLLNRFRSEAALAAVAADLVAPEAPRDQAVDVWLDFLKRDGPASFYQDAFATLENLTAVHSAKCVDLARRAYPAAAQAHADERPEERSAAPSPVDRRTRPTRAAEPPSKDRLAKRATWFERELERRHMTLSGLKKAHGPHPNTSRKILNAQPVTKCVLTRVVVGLSSVNPAVRRSDIP